MISVVICTRNGARSLPRALAALEQQRVSDVGIEVIVVDDHSTDDSAAIAAAAGATVIGTNGAGGLAAARNAGVEAASGAIVAFTDDDCEPEPTWISELVKPFADPSVDGVAGWTVPASSDELVFRYLRQRNPLAPLPASLLVSRNPVYRLWLYLRTSLGPSQRLKDGSALYSVAGANMAFRRQMLDAIGGFDAAIAFGGEEEELCRRAHQQAPSTRFVFARSAVVRHHYRPGVGDTLRRARAYGRGNARQALTDKGTWPILYPFPPLAALAFAALLLTNARRAWLGLALPLLTYPGWSGHAVRRRDPEALVFPYLQLAQELATMVGELDEFRTRVKR